MQRFAEGDRVRIDIPDETDADVLTADEQDAQLYRVVLDSGETADFRRRDLRPSITD